MGIGKGYDSSTFPFAFRGLVIIRFDETVQNVHNPAISETRVPLAPLL